VLSLDWGKVGKSALLCNVSGHRTKAHEVGIMVQMCAMWYAPGARADETPAPQRSGVSSSLLPALRCFDVHSGGGYAGTALCCPHRQTSSTVRNASNTRTGCSRPLMRCSVSITASATVGYFGVHARLLPEVLGPPQQF
jgi:hypothetical protein